MLTYFRPGHRVLGAWNCFLPRARDPLGHLGDKQSRFPGLSPSRVFFIQDDSSLLTPALYCADDTRVEARGSPHGEVSHVVRFRPAHLASTEYE